jgi:hypothetical protein
MSRNSHDSAAVDQHLRFRLERWHRRCVYGTGTALLLTGVAWLVLRYLLRPVGEFGEAVHPLEPWMMKLHGAAAMFALFFVGSLLNTHVRRAIRHGRNLASGWCMVAVLLLLALTGYGLYYLAGEADRPLWSVLHWAVGLGAALLTVVHIVVGRRSVANRT